MIHPKAYKYRFYPTEIQKEIIAKHIGCSRYVFNYFLNLWQETYNDTGKGLTYNKCCKKLTPLKSELEWLKEVESSSLQQSLKNLNDAYQRFFSGQNNKPKFKSKKNHTNSFKISCTNHNIKRHPKGFSLPKIGVLKCAISRELKGAIVSSTISVNKQGKYYISVLVKETIEHLPKTGKSCGIDLGLIDFAIVSDMSKISNPKHFEKLEVKLVKEQRTLSRRKKFSNNWYKQKTKVSRIHEKIRNSRNDFLHKHSTNIIKNHDIIGIEDLNVKGLLQNSNLAKRISDAAWSKFRIYLEYKALWYGKEVIAVSRTFPSSQLCSKCNTQNKDVKKLNLRQWTCPICKSSHDRDINASINIKNEALRLHKLRTVGHTGLA